MSVTTQYINGKRKQFNILNKYESRIEKINIQHYKNVHFLLLSAALEGRNMNEYNNEQVQIKQHKCSPQPVKEQSFLYEIMWPIMPHGPHTD